MDTSFLKGKIVLVTGATGLIGKAIVKKMLDSEAIVYALIRNEEKAKKVFENISTENLKFIISDVSQIPLKIMGIDYIVHGASQTSSKAFIEQPVETISTAINGTIRMLEFANINKVKGFVYLSSMEIYGAPTTDEKIDEKHSTNLDTMEVRASYPESKRLCECLCASYAKEYGVPAMIVRLTQTFGPGVAYNDTRVFAEFARCVIEKKNIILNTKGDTKRSYLYTEDAVEAILTVLAYGGIGEAYNAANEKTYCSIYEMACMVAEKCADGEIKVIINENETIDRGYAPILCMNLDTRKLKSLGWEPLVGLETMYERMIQDMRQDIETH